MGVNKSSRKKCQKWKLILKKSLPNLRVIKISLDLEVFGQFFKLCGFYLVKNHVR